MAGRFPDITPVPTARSTMFPPPPPAPGSVSFTRKPATGTLTIDALMARQKEAAARQQEALAVPQTTLPGGIGQMLQSYLAGKSEYDAEQQEAASRDELTKLLSGYDPAAANAQAVAAQAMQYAPDVGLALMQDAISSRRKAAEQDQWTSIPTPEGESGQWYRNTSTGEEKKVGGGEGSGGAKITDISSAQGRFSNDENVVALKNASPMWNSMQDAMTRDTPQADLNMVIAMAKMFDPTSVVRTEEGEMVRQTGGLPQQVFGYWKMLTGDPTARLGEGVRAGMMQEAYSRMKGYHDAYKGTAKFYTDFATRNGMRPEDIVEPLPEPVPYGGGPKEPKVGPDGQLDFTGMTTAEIEAWTAAQEQGATP